jgi:hypothetical protein
VDQGVAAVPLSQLLPTASVFRKLSQVGLDCLAAASSIDLVNFDFQHKIWHSSTSFRLSSTSFRLSSGHSETLRQCRMSMYALITDSLEII